MRSTASTFYQGHYQGNVPVATTNAGYTDAGMQNRQFPSGVVGSAGASFPLTVPAGGEYYAVKIADTTPATAPASFRFAKRCGWNCAPKRSMCGIIRIGAAPAAPAMVA